MIRLVCFDLGRVLIRICDNWRHAAKVAGVPKEFPHPLGPERYDAIHKLVCAQEVGQIDHDEFCRDVSPQFGLDRSMIEAAWNVYLLGVYPGAVELIDTLNARGFATACLSNTNANHWGRMLDPAHPAWFPMDRFTHQFASHLIGYRKPDMGAYEHVERVSGFTGEQIAFFDDIEENIVAARQRGWSAAVVSRDEDPIKQVKRHLVRFNVLSHD